MHKITNVRLIKSIPQKIKTEILNILDKSDLARERSHAENTLLWVKKLKPNTSLSLQIAALAHDIERSSSQRYKSEDFQSYEEYKKAHSERGAVILEEILRCHNLDEEIVSEATNLVKLHEIGGTENADILMDADSISFFDNNLDFYLSYKGLEGTIKQMNYKFQRCSPRAKKYIRSLEKYKSFKKMFNKIKMSTNGR